MEHYNSFITWLVVVLAAAVVAEGTLAPLLTQPPVLPPSAPPPLPPHPSPSLPPLPPHLSPAPMPLPPHPSPVPPISPASVAPAPSLPDTPCYPALLTCKNANTSDPSKICCDNLGAVYENGTGCICKVVESPELSKELGLNATDVSNLLVECKITDTKMSLCTAPVPPPSPNEATIVTTKLVWMSTFAVSLFWFFIV